MSRLLETVSTLRQLLHEAKKYIVYVDGEEKETITAGGHNAAEKKAQKKYPGKQVSVSYTETLDESASFTILVFNGMTKKSDYKGTFATRADALEQAAAWEKEWKKFMAYELWTGTPDKPGKFVEYLFGRKKGDKINPKTNTWESLDEAGGPKFKVGDIVRRTAAAMRSMGVVSGPVNGKVVGYSGRFALIQWSDMDDDDEPMAQADAGLELDKRANKR